MFDGKSVLFVGRYVYRKDLSKSVLANLYQRSNIFVPLYIFGEPLGIALLEARSQRHR